MACKKEVIKCNKLAGFEYKERISRKLMKMDLNIVSESGSLRIIEAAVDELSNKLKINSDSYGKILVATMEAVNNAIVHGNKSDIKKLVRVAFLSETGNLTITVSDEGPGFNPAGVPDPTAPENIESINGRGVFLMRNLADNITFNEKGNEVKMIFNL